MVSKNVKKGIAILFGITILGFSITGCGGGGDTLGSTATAPAESERVIIDEVNSEQVTAVALGIGSDSSSIPLTKSVGSDADTLNLGIMATPALKKALSITKDFKVLATSGSFACDDGGSVSYSGTSTSGIMTYNSCQLGDMTINGTVSVSANSSATSATFTYTNFSIADAGEIVVSFDSLEYTYQVNSSSVISHMTLTINGYITYFDEKIEYNNYIFDITNPYSNDLTFTINGYIKTACLNAWLKVETTETIQKNFFDSCPTAGQIVVGGNSSSLTIDFISDGSVNVSGDVEAHYTNCTQLDGTTCSL